MKALFVIILAAGAMSPNYTLEDVHHNRNIHWDANLPIEGFVCRGGTWNSVGMVGEKVWHYDLVTHTIVGPILIVDTAANADRGIMESHGLALDTDCDWLWKRYGIVFKLSDHEMIDYLSIPIVEFPSYRPSENSFNRIINHPNICGVDTVCPDRTYMRLVSSKEALYPN